MKQDNSMEPVVIDEAILDTHFNFIEYEPAPDALVEVICFNIVNDPINTFDKFRGKTDDERSNNSILLSHPVTKVSVVNGAITDSGPATPDDGIVMIHEDDYNNIYWKYHNPAMKPIRRQKKTAPEPITPQKIKPPVTMSPVSVMSPTSLYGGKRTKRRKKKRKTRRR